jgi:hypothetical protein
MQPKNQALRKRTQIATANRVMFFWVAGVSVVFSAAIVVSYFLIQMTIFNEKVLGEQGKTISVLKSDLSNIDTLKDKVLELDTNSALKSIKAAPDDQPLQVILDALPSSANSLALGASLQNKLLSGIGGLEISALQVDPVIGVESFSSSDTSAAVGSITGSQQGEITFHFEVSGDVMEIKQVLLNLEKSIRTIYVVSMKIETQSSSDQTTPKLTLNVQGKAFYEPARKVELKDKVIK